MRWFFHPSMDLDMDCSLFFFNSSEQIPSATILPAGHSAEVNFETCAIQISSFPTLYPPNIISRSKESKISLTTDLPISPEMTAQEQSSSKLHIIFYLFILNPRSTRISNQQERQTHQHVVTMGTGHDRHKRAWE